MFTTSGLYNWISTSVMTGIRPVSAEFTVARGLPSGMYSLCVVANGIRFDPVEFAYHIPTPSITLASGKAQLEWNESNQTYHLQFTLNLAQPNWSDLRGAVIAINSTILVTNEPTGPQSFYRLMLVQ